MYSIGVLQELRGTNNTNQKISQTGRKAQFYHKTPHVLLDDDAALGDFCKLIHALQSVNSHWHLVVWSALTLSPETPPALS